VHVLALVDGHRRNFAGHRGAKVIGIVRIGFGMPRQRGVHALVDGAHLARLTIQFEEHGPRAILFHITDGQQLDDEGFALFDFNGDFL